MEKSNKKIAIVGLGYVGLPLAVEFGKLREVIGFDINKQRIRELIDGFDCTCEIEKGEIESSQKLKFSDDADCLKDCSIFIVTVPTPVDKANRPDLGPLISATKTVAGYIKKGSLIIYESTVYPGATEEICVPILEKYSDLIFNKDFFCGYSPERINPGDKINTLKNIKKITSGSTRDSAQEVDELYKSIILAGTYLAESIKVAEAAKVIENTQRDLNIALVNELSLIFHRLGIDTLDVIKAASTKWNFLPFKPGLVGGHCIGVDPYYLTHKAQEVGYHPEVILAGRRVNDNIVNHIANETIRLMLNKKIDVANSRILILGITFKENCPDLRNSKILDLINVIKSYNIDVDVYDPWIKSNQISSKYRKNFLEKEPDNDKYSGIILAVGHLEFIKWGIKKIKNFGKLESILFDVKGLFSKDEADGRL